MNMAASLTRAEDFRVDVIQNSIQDLQKEREKTKYNLQELRKKRISLEKKYEAVTQKHNQMSEKHQKMLETVKVAQLKVTQSQTQVDRQLAINKQKQERIDKLRRLIDLEHEEEERDIEEWQQKISELTDKFRNARHFYTDESLQLEISMLEKKDQEIQNKVAVAKSEVGKLQKRLAELQSDVKSREDSCKAEFEFSQKERENILSIFTQEKEDAQNFLQAMLEKEIFLQEEMKRVNEETELVKAGITTTMGDNLEGTQMVEE